MAPSGWAGCIDKYFQNPHLEITMRYHDLVASLRQTTPPATALPYIVECDGLTRLNLNRPGEFEQALNDRRQWCDTHALGAHDIESIGPGPEQLTGRRFRFADEKTAAMFKVSFETNLWPRGADTS
jgi:hypothetical protein